MTLWSEMTCIYPHLQNVSVPELKYLARKCVITGESPVKENQILWKDSVSFPVDSQAYDNVLQMTKGELHEKQKHFETRTCLDNSEKHQQAACSSQSDMKLEANRLRTFQNHWPLQFVKPSDLAAVGLYYLGCEDRVQCAFCQGIISDWEEGDDPLREHARHFPMCPFLLNCDVGNVPLSGSNGMQKWQVSKSLPETSKPLGSVLSESPRSADSFKPKHPTMGSFDKRLETFRHWPSTIVTPPELAESGLFYSGVADVVTCFFCGGSLGDWSPGDEAWTEHAKHYPNCVYVKCIKGSNFLQAARRTSELPTGFLADHQPLPQSSGTFQQPATSETTVSRPVKSCPEASGCTSAHAEASGEQARYLCKICMEEGNRVAFLPCGHSLACQKCAGKLSTCPVCRKKVESTIRIYID